jgi:antitoxin (DNA-binding transcriptional repressor) of toxin-antitoxin stability system
VDRKIAPGRLKAHCLTLLDDVQKRPQTIVITRRGTLVANLAPAVAGPTGAGAAFGGDGDAASSFTR